MRTIGIIGNGFVGNAYYYYFTQNIDCSVSVYDKQLGKSRNSLAEVCKSEIIFICVPTPTLENGLQDISHVRSALSEVSFNVGANAPIIVIKSTILPGSTLTLQGEFPKLSLVFSPEFLDAATAYEDVKNPKHDTIIGCDDERIADRVLDIFNDIIPQGPMQVVGTKEAEMIKYMTNTYMASKNCFMNQMYGIASALKLNWSLCVAGFLGDNRIGPTHTTVPGPDGSRGFAGACLPKDLGALITLVSSLDPNACKFLTCVEEINSSLRQDIPKYDRQ